MNHIFRSLWSESLGTWVAVSELVPSQGKRHSRLARCRVCVQASGFGLGNDWSVRSLCIKIDLESI